MTIRNKEQQQQDYTSYGSTQPVVVGGEYTEAEPLVGIDNNDFAEPVFRDVFWALLFVAHLGVMVFLAVVYGSFGTSSNHEKTTQDWKAEMEAEMDDDEAIHQVEAFAEQVEAYVEVYPMRILTYILVPCVLLAFVFSFVGTALVIPSCPTTIVQFSLLGSVGLTIALTVLMSVSTGSWFAWLMSAGLIAIVIYYVKIVWNLIPFASVNLKISLKGVSANWGIYMIAFLFSILGFVWTIFWAYVSIGVLGHEQLESGTEDSSTSTSETVDDDDDDAYYESQGDQAQQGFTIFLLLVSLYWTSTVILVSARSNVVTSRSVPSGTL
jgi:hypothetical protein